MNSMLDQGAAIAKNGEPLDFFNHFILSYVDLILQNIVLFTHIIAATRSLSIFLKVF